MKEGVSEIPCYSKSMQLTVLSVLHITFFMWHVKAPRSAVPEMKQELIHLWHILHNVLRNGTAETTPCIRHLHIPSINIQTSASSLYEV